MNNLEWFLAFRYLRTRRREGFISVIAIFSLLGIMLGVATLIIVLSVMNGFRAELFDRILGVTGHLRVQSTEGNFPNDPNKWAQLVDEHPDLVRGAAILEAQVLISSDSGSSGVLLRGVAPDKLQENPKIAEALGAQFDAQQFAESNGVVLGYRLAQTLGVGIGDEVRLLSPNGQATAFGTVPVLKTYPIFQTFNFGQYEYDSSFVYLPLREAQQFLSQGDRISFVEFATSDADLAPLLVTAMRGKLDSGQYAVSWQQINGSFYEALQTERNVMAMILTMIILVAAFNIISGQIMLVRDKHKAIAILRSLGLTRGGVIRVFLICGATIGVIGTILGILLGTLFASNIDAIKNIIQALIGTELFSAEFYYLSRLPAHVVTGEVITIALLALLLTFCAAFYPAWRSGRIDPVEALRYG